MHRTRTDEVPSTITSDRPEFSERRGRYVRVTAHDIFQNTRLTDADREVLDRVNLIYRTLCGILYNFMPTSGHPGGSISSGHIVDAWATRKVHGPGRGARQHPDPGSRLKARP